MNEAYGNPKGDLNNINFDRLWKQCENIGDELKELFTAINECDQVAIRDALCDISVFTFGAFHMIGADADADMHAVYKSNMSKFIECEEDRVKTEEKYRDLGVPVAFEGEFPTMRCRCLKTVTGADGEDYRERKILKSVSYRKPVFADPT